jgi:hypothetical protein
MTEVRERTIWIRKGKLRRSRVRVGLGPPLFFVAFCLLSLVVGTLINNRYYQIERGVMTLHKPVTTGTAGRPAARE